MDTVIRPEGALVHIPSLQDIWEHFIRRSNWADKGLEDFVKADIDYLVDTIKARITRASAYTFGHNHFLSDLPAAIVGDVTLGSKTATDGYLDCADMVFALVPAGAAINQVSFYKDTGVAATSRVFLHVDGFSVVPNGGDITLVPQATSPFLARI